MTDLIHCITNPISMMQCANTVLALGSKPIMAEHPLEVKEITQTASALLLNTGNISDTRMKAMEISFDTALEKGIPIVIDAVGAACSELRRSYIFKLLNKTRDRAKTFLVLKGNYSEIKAICDASYKGKGVDADKSLESGEMTVIAEKLASELGAVILASGEKDIVSDGRNTFFISAGTPMLGHITGTGCMLGAVCASFISQKADLKTVVKACEFFGKAGDRAFKTVRDKNEEVGGGSFLMALLDSISVMHEREISMKRMEKEALKLYLVTDSTGLSVEEFLARAEAAIRGGATIVQLREKEKSTREYMALAKRLHAITKKHRVPLIIDDRIDVAMAIDAEGVHLGQSDMPVDVARKILGDDKIIGATAKTVSQAVEAFEQGADYLGVGAIYPTTTKVKTVLTSVDTLKDICAAVPIPVNAIGGLNKDNLEILKGAPIAGICVVSAIMKSTAPETAAAELISAFNALEGT